jgi:hypothetical protein
MTVEFVSWGRAEALAGYSIHFEATESKETCLEGIARASNTSSAVGEGASSYGAVSIESTKESTALLSCQFQMFSSAAGLCLTQGQGEEILSFL